MYGGRFAVSWAEGKFCSLRVLALLMTIYATNLRNFKTGIIGDPWMVPSFRTDSERL